MKKVIALVLTMVFLFSLTTGVFADTVEGTKTKQTDPKVQALKDQIKALKAEKKLERQLSKEQREELKPMHEELKTLNEQRKAQIEQVKDKRALAKQLVQKAYESGDTAKIEAAKAYKAQMEAINTETKALIEEKKDVRAEIKTAKESDNFELVKADLSKLINYKKEVIAKVNEKLAMMDNIIAELQ